MLITFKGVNIFILEFTGITFFSFRTMGLFFLLSLFALTQGQFFGGGGGLNPLNTATNVASSVPGSGVIKDAAGTLGSAASKVLEAAFGDFKVIIVLFAFLLSCIHSLEKELQSSKNFTSRFSFFTEYLPQDLLVSS